ncbi:MAG: serine/threonine protein kinase, partial [Desulfobacteraceae bacterium]|nr:serine/threonine protein kinase [Desulfobacteraceae bacterium]
MARGKEPFELIEHLGTGGFAQTWRTHIVDQELIDDWGVEEVAIKIPLTRHNELLLRKEVELTGSLCQQMTEIEGKNIVDYLGFEIFEGQVVMVMRYIPGGNLRKIIGRIGKWKPLEVQKAVEIALGILKGLSVIHKKHIIHRDITPENILMDGKIPKISDFGVGRILKTNELASTGKGTFWYKAPELLYEERGASFNVDLWSFGVTFYEMLCGQFPFGINEKTPEGKITSLILDNNIKLLFPKKMCIPEELQKILKRTLERNRHYRYKTANEVIDDLREVCERDDDTIEKEISSIRSFLCDPVQVSVAENKLKGILKKFPDSPLIYLHFGDFYNKCGNYDKA